MALMDPGWAGVSVCVHLEACIHEDVHVGSTADWSFLTPPFGSWRQ